MHHRMYVFLAMLTSVACAPSTPETADVTREAPLRGPVQLPGMQVLDVAKDGRALYGKLPPALPNSDVALAYTLMFRDMAGKLHPIKGVFSDAILHPTNKDTLFLVTTQGPLVRYSVGTGTRTEIHVGPDFAGLAASGDRLTFAAGTAPDFDIYVQGKVLEKWTLQAEPRWRPFFFEDGRVGVVTQELGRPSVVSMAAQNHVPKVWAHEPTLFPTRAPAPFLDKGKLYFTYSGGVAALDESGAVTWHKKGAKSVFQLQPGKLHVEGVAQGEVAP